MKYSYSLLRFVPNPARGEFVNFGLIAGSDTESDWAVQLVSSRQHANKLDDAKSFGPVMALAEEIAAIVSRFREFGDNTVIPQNSSPSEAWLAGMHEQYRHIFQVTAPAFVSAPSADHVIDLLFPLLVVDREPKKRPPDKRYAISRMRQAYASHGVSGSHLLQKAHLHAGPTEISVDFAVANGKVLQITQAWALNLKNERDLLERIRSFAYMVGVVKDEGGHLANGGRVLDVPKGVDVSMVVVPDSEHDGRGTEQEARAVFSSIGATVHPVEDADAVALVGNDRLQRAHENT